MVNYEPLKQNQGKRVAQTIDSPIMVMDYFELNDVFLALGIILLFGIVFYAWFTMVFLLALTLGLVPIVRRRNEKGIFLHFPYRYLSMSLPGLINPQGRRKFSD